MHLSPTESREPEGSSMNSADRRSMRSRRGISTVVSTLLMVVVVVAASSIAILWSTGALQQLSDYFGNQTSTVQEAIAIEDVYYNRTTFSVCSATLKPDHCIQPYVRNIGPVAVFLTAIFITNSTRITEITLTRQITLGAGQLAVIPCYATSTSCPLPTRYYPTAGTTVTIKVVTSRGTSDIFQLFVAT